jgi:hypothetical protein
MKTRLVAISIAHVRLSSLHALARHTPRCGLRRRYVADGSQEDPQDPAWHKVRDESERDGPIVATILGAEVKIRDPFSRTTIERAFDAAGSDFVTRRMLGCFRENALTRQDFHGYRMGWK